MATEETKGKEEVIEENVENEQEEPKNEQPKEKMLTQSQVNLLIQREKAIAKKYKEQLDEITSGENETLKKYESTIQKLVDDMSGEVPEPIKKLLTKMTPLEQLEYLSDPSNQVIYEKKQFPLSPQKKSDGKGEFKPEPVEKFI
jgi:DNA anti-recombination protein RmuC